MKRVLFVALCFCVACGGSEEVTEPPPPNPLYVSPAGSDNNEGTFDAPLRSIAKAAQIARDDYEILVAPGTYGDGISTDRLGEPAERLRIFADPTGDRTGARPGEVRIDVAGRAAEGISLSNSAGTIVDGFSVTGATGSGIVVKGGSHGVTIRNCVVFRNDVEGILIQDSNDVTLLNNLVYENEGTGIVVAGRGSGSRAARVVNNTIALNGTRESARGITIGNTSTASPGAYVRNNILFENAAGGTVQLRVLTQPRSDLGFDGDFNLVFPGSYDPESAAGPNDLNADPRFGGSGADVFRLLSSSPAIDAGDDGIPPALANIIRNRSTSNEGDPDEGILDMGFHFRR